MCTEIALISMLVLALACGGTQSSQHSSETQQPIVTSEEDPTRHRTEEPDPEGEVRRERSTAKLRALGFEHAASLPTTKHRAGIAGRLRPQEEIARRLMALQALNLWVFAAAIPDQVLLGYIEVNELRSMLTPDELTILTTSRAQAERQYGGRMGWTQENMWPLAWALGFDIEPTPQAGLIDDTVVAPLLSFLPQLNERVETFLQRAQARSETDILDLEDLFYCAHNAARSAQLGSSRAVPNGFDPIRNGGAVHERRHSLTWLISVGTSWDDTDLST